jgi:hypothetical protein
MRNVSTLHLLKRKNGGWYYRRRIPADLIEFFGGKKIIQVSLGSSKKSASKKREIADVEWTRKFDEARMSMSSSGEMATEVKPDAARPITPPHAVRLVQAEVERRDQLRQERWRAERPTSPAEIAEARQLLEEDLYIARGRAPVYECEQINAREADRMLATSGRAHDEKVMPA